ncbi:hypothetical protein EVJ58_g6056 [Rhodofomes roseus]|uniref:DUF3140 domain-containing protein n=1 Tax=Rhodofomes roseus TaxID=34475 RepID=A0A4Y9YAD6_9APHY|nr:hypothetical protein EVJ58_g6056 [Rhodofomes roseus]
MVKSREDVIAQFNEDVNMSVDELQQWLDDPKSTKAGTGVGIESGHKIIEILKKNPDKDPEKYDDEDIEHMRKVVSYSARHLAQEDKLKETKTKEELENTKSTISLRNWGHDPIKTLDENEGAANGEDTYKNAEPAEQGTVNGAKHDEKITANGEKKANKGVEPEQKEQTQASSKRKLGEGGVVPHSAFGVSYGVIDRLRISTMVGDFHASLFLAHIFLACAHVVLRPGALHLAVRLAD